MKTIKFIWHFLKYLIFIKDFKKIQNLESLALIKF